MDKMQDVLKELSKPFHPSHVTWKPGATNRDKTSALAMAYADLRAYQNRLDEVCGMNWGVNYTPWGDRIVCHLTINGVTRSSTGEPDSQSEKSEIAGTASEAQAFKRACAMFGLGRYLYELPTVWADYDGDRRQFTEAGKARLTAIITQHYKRHREDEPQPEPVAQPQPASNGNGCKVEPAEKPLPFAENHEAAVDWGFQQGPFDAMKHAQNAYKKLATDNGWKAGEGSKISTPALFRLWVAEVEKRVAEKNQEKVAA